LLLCDDLLTLYDKLHSIPKKFITTELNNIFYCLCEDYERHAIS
jgi:hypothetical protein